MELFYPLPLPHPQNHVWHGPSSLRLLHPAVFSPPDGTAVDRPLPGSLCNPGRSPAVSGGHGVDFIFRYCNKEMAVVEGVPVEEMLNRSFYEVFRKDRKSVV